MIRYLITLLLFTTIVIVTISFHIPNRKALLTRVELNEINFTSYEYINANLLVYPLKRFKEEVDLKLTPKLDIREYEYTLLEARFKELVYIINYQKTSFLPENINRYNSYVGYLKMKYPVIKDDEKINIQQYLNTLNILRDRYPANSSYWMSIQQTVDTTKSLL